MIYLQLFWEFFKIGLFTFGGGYAMIPLIQQQVVGRGWLTEDTLINYIGISEATPGPFAINIATFVGTSQAGVLGALCTTLGVVLPSFIIILIIAILFKNFAQNKYVKGVLGGITPVVCALIIGTGVMLFVKNFITTYGNSDVPIQFDWYTLVIIAIVVLAKFAYKLTTKKNLSAIWLIMLSALCGMALYPY